MYAKVIEASVPDNRVMNGDCALGGSPCGAACSGWGGSPGFGCVIGWSPG